MASTNLSGSIFTDEVDLYVRRGGSISPPYSVIAIIRKYKTLIFNKYTFLLIKAHFDCNLIFI